MTLQENTMPIFAFVSIASDIIFDTRLFEI
jgi:hypothetical protein